MGGLESVGTGGVPIHPLVEGVGRVGRPEDEGATAVDGWGVVTGRIGGEDEGIRREDGARIDRGRAGVAVCLRQDQCARSALGQAVRVTAVDRGGEGDGIGSTVHGDGCRAVLDKAGEIIGDSRSIPERAPREGERAAAGQGAGIAQQKYPCPEGRGPRVAVDAREGRGARAALDQSAASRDRVGEVERSRAAESEGAVVGDGAARRQRSARAQEEGACADDGAARVAIGSRQGEGSRTNLGQARRATHQRSVGDGVGGSVNRAVGVDGHRDVGVHEGAVGASLQRTAVEEELVDRVAPVGIGGDGIGRQGAASQDDLVGEAEDAGIGTRTQGDAVDVGGRNGAAVDDELVHHVGSISAEGNSIQ